MLQKGYCVREWPGSSVVRISFSKPFEFPAPFLRSEPPLARSGCRFCCDAFFSGYQRRPENRSKLFQCDLFILPLTAGLLNGDPHGPRFIQSLCEYREKARTKLIGNTSRMCDVKNQFNACFEFIDILTARTAAAACPEFDLRRRDAE